MCSRVPERSDEVQVRGVERTAMAIRGVRRRDVDDVNWMASLLD